MGQMKQNPTDLTFTPVQKIIFDEFAKNSNLTKRFYFTGGTALSAVYIHHRESEDLDFFSRNEFESIPVDRFINNISEKIQAKPHLIEKEVVRIYEFIQNNRAIIKVDFAYYPYRRIKKGIQINGVTIDSIRDIATNKLHTITSRTEVKDFVDLYFLLKEFSLWDLLYGVEHKFGMELDLVWLSSDFLKVNQFKYLPKMLVPLELKDLKKFYKDLAKKLGTSVTKK